MRSVLPLAVCLIGLAACSGGYRSVASPTPDAARFVTDDIARFYAVFDALPDSISVEDAARRFETGYFAVGSEGLHSFRDRTGDARAFAEAVLARRQFYRAIRRTALDRSLDQALADSARAAYRALDAIYPDARFPDVYLVIGRLRTGGTVKRPGLILGIEHYSGRDGVPMDELAAWQRTALFEPAMRLPLTIHELMHAQQRPRGRFQKRTRLYEALAEGCPDYLAERLVGRHPNAAEEAWALPREAELWAEFEAGLHETDFGDWFYRTPERADQPDRPVDLGYTIGKWICASYVENADDEQAALRDVIRFDDPARIFRESGYAD